MKTKTKFVFNKEEAKVIWKIIANFSGKLPTEHEEIIANRLFEQLDEELLK